MATEACNDTSNQTQQANLNRARGPYTNRFGEFTLDQVDVFTEQLAQNIKEDRETNPVLKLVNRYGDEFYESANAVNTFRNRREASDLTSYPDLANRWARGNISQIEVAAFIEAFNYTPIGLTNKCNGGDPFGLLFELDAYYKNTFTQSVMGGFCASIPGVFGAIDAFFDIIDTVDGLVKDAFAILSKLRNMKDPLQAAIEKITVESLLKQIKDLIVKTVTDIFEKVQKAIQNFNIEDIIGDVSTFVRENVVKRIMQQREEMCLFFCEANKERIKKKAANLIDYIASIIENPGLEEIQFMVTRFCSFIGQIEGLMNDIKSPLDTYGGKYSRISNRLKRISNLNTSTAIRNGAIRYDDETRKETINSIEQDWENEDLKGYTPTGEKPSNVKKPSIKEYGSLPDCCDVFEGKDSRVKVSGDWVEDEDCGIEGWVKVDLDVKVYLMRLQEKLGAQINVINGYRSQQYNEKIGGAEESSYMSGMVIDIELIGDSDTLAELALKSGFKTVAVSADKVRLDIRSRPTA